jgi:prolipoprotein diacylglyceryltransferase
MNSEIIGKAMASGNGVVFIKNSERNLNQGNLLEEVSYSKLKESSTFNTIKYPKIEVTMIGKKGVSAQQLENHYQRIAGQYLYNENYNPHHRDFYIDDSGVPLLEVKTIGGKAVGKFQAYVITRHPAQLYESSSCLILFLILFVIYRSKSSLVPNGLLFGIFVIYIFGLRFIYEFIKENQVAMEDDMILNMGQKLSIPLVVAGFYLIWNAFSKKQTKVFTNEEEDSRS